MSIISRFSEIAAKRTDQIALITQSSQMTYGDLLRVVQRLDDALSGKGIRAGQTVILATDRAEFTIAFSLLLSLRSLRVIFSPVEAVLESQLDYDWIVTTQPALTVPPDRQVILQPDWFDGLESAPIPDYSAAAGSGDGAFVSRTSGSTGRSKFVWNTEDQRLVRIDKWLGQEPDPPAQNRRVAISMSPANVWALTGALAALFRGGSVLMLSADRERLLGYLDLYRADTLLATPALLSQLAGDPASAQYLGGLRDIRVGGAQAPRNVIARLAEICGARIHLTYGAAEVGAVFAFTYDPSAPQPEGYLGRPVETGLQVGLYSDAQEPLPEDAVEGNLGIRVTDPSILRRYLKKGGELEEVTQLGDVFFPGDLVRRENDEYLYVGRTKNVLNAGGEKYALDVIGRHLTNVLGGSMVVPLVKQDEAGNEALVLITERSPIDLDAARAALATRFPSARVLAAEAVERFPLTPSGKVDPSALARAVGIRS